MALLNRGIIFFVVVVFAAAELVGNAAAATYVVGDSLGWRVPPGGAADYATWASQHTFRVGDVFVFNFNTGLHDAAKVGQGAYDGCTSTNPIALATVGPASFVLNSTGPDFYICTFGQHCSLGQKLAINVTSSSTTPTPAPLPPTIMPPSSAPPQLRPTIMPPSSAPAQLPPTIMPPSSAPAPSPPTIMPPSSAPALSPLIGAPSSSSSSPAPTPYGLSTSSFPVGDFNPPPPPSSAAITTIHFPIIIFVSIIFALVIQTLSIQIT